MTTARRAPEPSRFYFSFRSPYSWIGSRLLQRWLDERPPDAPTIDIEYIPYWEPDENTHQRVKALGGEVVYAPMSRQKHLYILQDIKRMAASLGYTHVWPVDERPWWDLSHLAYLAAKRAGKAPEFYWAVYAARWEEGLDISAPATMRTLAIRLGLDPGAIAGAASDPSLRDEGARALCRAYRDGVFGLPFFVRGFDRYWGVDRIAAFVDALTGRDDRRYVRRPS